MTPTVWIAVVGYVVVVPLICASLRHRSVILAAIVLGWLFLPNFRYAVPALPDITKEQLVGIVGLSCTLVFEPMRLVRIGLGWRDLPILVWCLAPMASSLSNGDGVYTGASGVFTTVLIWGAPWFVGRALVRTPDDVRMLARVMILGGVAYLPVCLFEIRMAPQLHSIVYGYFQHSFSQVRRFGGWRPVGFLQHGLAVGLWMASTAVVAAAVAFESRWPRFLRIPVSLVALGLVLVAVGVKSAGAIALLAAGLLAILLRRVSGFRVGLAALVLFVPAYMSLRIATQWTGDGVVELVEPISETHAGSLRMRLVMDRRLASRALERPVFGWGGFARARILDDEQGKVITDTLWIIAFGEQGFVGLTGLFGALLVPQLSVLRRPRLRSPDRLTRRTDAAMHGLALALVIFTLDSLLNAMFNPAFLVIAGALVSMAGRPIGEAQATGRHPRSDTAPNGEPPSSPPSESAPEGAAA